MLDRIREQARSHILTVYSLEDIGVIRFDPVQAQVIEEVGEAHPCRQRVQVTELIRQILRWHHQSFIHQLAQGPHVFQRGLAAKQQRYLLKLCLLYTSDAADE